MTSNTLKPPLSTGCAQARTFLFVPGNRPERFEKAARSGADAIVLDLEDSVPPAGKAAAREAIEREWPRLHAMAVPLVVRVNPAGCDAGMADVAWLARLAPCHGVMLPKAESGDAVAHLHDALGGVGVLPLIESAAGLAALPSIAAAAGVIRLVVGHIDFMADLGLQCDDAEMELAPLRFAVAMATRLHRLSGAVDGVTVRFDDDTQLAEDTRRAIRFGFTGKLCIHPNQVPAVHAAFAPTAQELDWARRVIAAEAAAGGSAVQLDGRMVDLPVVLQARRLLQRAEGASRPSR
jgi:citrate lyase subunit beta / citryl-CoA lyase